MSWDDERKSSGPEKYPHVMWGPVLYLLSSVLLHAAVDVTEPSSRQHVRGLLVDESVKMSLDLENVEKQQIKIHSGRLRCESPLLVLNGEPLRP